MCVETGELLASDVLFLTYQLQLFSIFMDRWTGILKVPVYPKGTASCQVAASLCVSHSAETLIVPKANAIFFNGDRVEGTGNPVIERLSDLRNIAEILVCKFGARVNAWVVEASTFNGPFAVYKDFVQSPNQWGEPDAYKPEGFPASTSIISLLSNFLLEREKYTQHGHDQPTTMPSSCLPQTLVLGFSKGGVVLNQLLTELAFLGIAGVEDPAQFQNFSRTPWNQIVPNSRQKLLESITEVHYVDVGLNSPGAYLTDDIIVNRIAEQLKLSDRRMRVLLHGTPRQWHDTKRAWIGEEKNKLLQLLESGGNKCGGKLEVCERTYFTDRCSDLQMHFQIIEELLVT